jgi:hypothetical protein
MKTRILPLSWLPAVLAMLAAVTTAHAFGPYDNPYDGTVIVQTGKKQGALAASANATTSDGSDATVVLAGEGPKGVKVNVTLELKSNGTGTLSLNAKVLADKSQMLGNEKFSRGKKVNVRIKARGTYTVVDDTTVALDFSGNSGKGGGANITGTFTTDTAGNMTLTLKSGFKQKVSGLGRRISLSFTGVSSTAPM